MNSIINILLVSFGLVLVTSDVGSQTQNLSCAKSSQMKIDSIFSKLIVIGNSGRKWPELVEELPIFCNSSMDMVKTVDDHNQRCNKKLVKQVMSLAVYTARQQVTHICKKSKKRDQLMSAFPCGNKSNKEVDKCLTKLIDAMIGAQNLVDDRFKIPSFCCDYHKFTSCVTKAYDGTDGCSVKDKEVMLSLIDSSTSNVMNLLCGEYEEDSDKCRALSTPRKLKSQKRTKSFFIPLIQLLQSFKEN